LGEKHPRVASEAFRVFSSLLGALKPVRGQDWVESVYEEAIARLANHATDADVRSSAEDVIGDLWLNAPDTVHTKSGQEWDYVCRTTGRTDGAVKVVIRVAREADISEEWISGCVEWATKLLTKSGRTGKAEVFECLSVLLSRSVLSLDPAPIIDHSPFSDTTTTCQLICYAL
jgi:cullin-associated NEDD8-dissociated protein 1